VAWGNNNYGQTDVPSGLSNVVAVAGGYEHSLALRSDGTVVAWGGNNYGQTNVPSGLSNVVAVAGGYEHSLALRSDGTVVVWGGNRSGQTNVPSGLSNVVAVAGGDYHNLALRRDGTVVAWGGNWIHQSDVPPSLSNVVAVAVAGGSLHSLALTIPNYRPAAQPQTLWAYRGVDKVIRLAGTDPEGEAVSLRVKSLPGAGRLYQYDGAGRGAAIESPDVVVSDPGGRVVYAPPDSGSGPVEDSFEYVANDGGVDSVAARVRISVDHLPEAHTHPAAFVSTSDAMLRGMVHPYGRATAAWFEWGKTPALGNVTGVTNIPALDQVVWVTLPAGSLQPRQAYYCRLVASNRLGLTQGRLEMFGVGSVAAWGWNNTGQTTVPPGLNNAVAVAGGESHSLASRTDGTVVVWGDNTYGQRNVPSDLSNVVAVAGGCRHSLALRSDGTVAAWGRNDYGQTNVPSGLSNVMAVAGGYYHNLALHSDGTVTAWGRNDYGQTNVPFGLSNVVAVAAGELHSLALRSDGTVVAWGRNNYDQTNVPSGLSNVVSLAAGWAHNLALRSDGTVVAWGHYFYGQTTIPPGLSNVVAVAGGNYHSLALRSDGTVVVWGNYEYGQANVPFGLSNVVSVTAGGNHCLAVSGNLGPAVLSQTVYAYRGVDKVVRLQVTDPEGDAVRLRVTSLPGAGRLYQYDGAGRGVAIESPDTEVTDPGGRVVYAPPGSGSGLLKDGFEYAANDWQLDSLPATVRIEVDHRLEVYTHPAAFIGVSEAVLRGMVHPYGTATVAWFEWGTTPALGIVQVVTNTGADDLVWVSQSLSGLQPRQAYYCRLVASNITGVVHGALQTFGLGRVEAWAGNHYYLTNVPVGLSNVVAVAAGRYYSLAVRSDGTVAAWGSNSSGQTNVPSGLSNVVAVAGGDSHSLALRSDGTVVGWGWNLMGQTSVPSGLSNVVAVAAGTYHSLALRRDGTVAAWGTYWDGSNYVPETVPEGLSNVVAVAARGNQSLALRSDGTVVAWGTYWDGSNWLPATVPAGLSNVMAVAAGTYHSLALRADPLAAPPRILAQPANQWVAVGDPATFCLTADGPPPLSYSWQRNGSPIPGATQSCYTLTNCQPSDSGAQFCCLVSNADGAVTSAPASLTVNPGWLDAIGLQADGQFRLILHSPPGRAGEIWASTNVALPLSQWTLLTTLTNRTGTVEWTDPATNLPQRFYRLRLPGEP